MNPETRLAYLNAIGIDVWIPRRSDALGPGFPDPAFFPAGSSAPAREAMPRARAWTGRLAVGPGSGNTLLLVAHAGEAATSLAADIARSLDGEPVWCWPDEQNAEASASLEQVIGERMITRLLVFGVPALVHSGILDKKTIGGAEVIYSDDMPALLASGVARRGLWSQLSARRWCGARGENTK